MSNQGYPGQPPAMSPYPPSTYPNQPPTYTPPGVPQQRYPPTVYMYTQPPAPPGLQMVNPYTNYPQAVHMIPQQARPTYTQTPYPQAQYQQPQQHVYVGEIFDSGARFDGVSQPSIPPPPPGCAPTGAQQMAMQGNPVVGTQQQSNWLTGGTGGGAFFL